MDDMFGMLINNSLSPERKLVAAITAGMPDTVQQLIRDGGRSLVNAVLQQQNGRAALHIACQTGRHTYIEWFIAAGGNPSQMDAFGMTPLELALRNGHELCVREMLLLSGDVDPAMLWTAQTRSGELSWKSFCEAVITELIIATPNLSNYHEISRILSREYIRHAQKYELFIRAFLLTGNRLQEEDAAEILKSGNANIISWIESSKKLPATLQHLARLAVRRSVQTNVHYAANMLPLPLRLQKYLVLADDCSDRELHSALVLAQADSVDRSR